jgi:branched-subunit amino acid ABC-type transport system permease component
MDAKVVADALFDGSVIALVAAATTVCLDLFGFLNLTLVGAFILGAAEEYAFAAAAAPQWERVAAGALAASIAGFLFDRFALHALRKRGATDLMLAAGLAAFLVILGYLAVFRLDAAVTVSRSPLSERVANVGGFAFSELQALAVALSILACIALHVAVYRTRFGLGVRAAIENPVAAQFMGVRADRVPPSAMAAVCALAGAAGALFAMHAAACAIAIPATVLITALAACALAPTGSVSIAVVLSFALTLAADELAAHKPALSAVITPTLMLLAVTVGVLLRSRSFLLSGEKAPT